MSDYHFELPLYGIAKPTKTSKNPALSVNWYRNAYYRDSNNAKKEFKHLMRQQLKHFDAIDGKVTIKYVYWSKSTRSSDIDNFVGTVKKFFQDALVECGLLPDDNFNIIVGSSESYGGVDRDNPRVDAYITVLTDFD